ncbi:MAG TPA: hypothetical protein VFZ01_14250 [Geminicoccaceae bacterium]
MHRSSIDDWIRFYDEVVVAGADWAPEAWFEAVGDAMARALPADSPILDTYRRRVEELLALEQRATGSAEDERRVSALEAEIQRLIGGADELIRTPRSVPATTAQRKEIAAARTLLRPRRRLFRSLGQTAAGLVLIGAGLLGALYLYDSRLAVRVDRELDRYVGGLRSSVERLHGELSAQVDANRAEQARLEGLQDALEADIASLSDRMSESLTTMMALRENATAELERRLDEKAGAVAGMLDQAARRAAELGESVEEVSGQIVALEQAMPALGDRLTRLAAEAEQSQTAFTEVTSRLAALDSLAPEIEELAASRRAALEEAIGRERSQLEGLGEKIAALSSDYQQSQSQLAGAQLAVDHELTKVAEQRAAMEKAVAGMRSARDGASALREEVELELAGARKQVRVRTDQVLGGLAEKADLAVLRSDDVLKRAEKRVAQELEAAAAEALAGHASARERELAGLAEDVARTRAELDRTRDGLIDSWKRMDEDALERHQALLADLDRYAAEVEARVAELMAALNVMVAAEERRPR